MSIKADIVRNVFLKIYTSQTLITNNLYRYHAGRAEQDAIDASPLAQKIFAETSPTIQLVEIDKVSDDSEYKSCITIRSQYKAWTNDTAVNMVRLVNRSINDFAAAVTPPVDEEAFKKTVKQKLYEPENPTESEQIIAHILNKEIIPTIHGHGGSLTVMKVEDNGPEDDVYLHLITHGACNGCQSSEAVTMKRAFGLLQNMFANQADFVENRQLAGLIAYDSKNTQQPAYTIPDKAAQTLDLTLAQK